MAKPDKKSDKKETAEKEDFKYGVEDVAEALGIKPASARVQLRNHNIEKAGKSYGWNSKADLEEVVEQLKGDSKSEKKVTKLKKKSDGKSDKKVKKEAA